MSLTAHLIQDLPCRMYSLSIDSASSLSSDCTFTSSTDSSDCHISRGKALSFDSAMDNVVFNRLGIALTKPHSKEINAQFHSESINGAQASEWVHAHHEYYQPALTEVVNKVKRIRHREFIGELKKVVEQFNEKLETVENKSYTILVQPHKSNQWVADWAVDDLNHLNHAEFKELGEKHASSFIAFLDRIKNTERVAQRIVLFDDCSYSGTQLSEHVKAIFTKYEAEHRANPTIHVIVPFITDYAFELIKKVGEEKKHRKLEIIYSKKIISVEQALSKEHILKLKELYNWSAEPIETQGRGLIYFDHKIPNGMSFIKPFAEGHVYLGHGIHVLDKPVKKIFKILPSINPPYKL